MYLTSHPSRQNRFCRVASLICILTLLLTAALPATAAPLSVSSKAYQGPALQTNDDLVSSAQIERSIDQIWGEQKIAHDLLDSPQMQRQGTVSYTHLRAHETDSYLVCRLLLEKK